MCDADAIANLHGQVKKHIDSALKKLTGEKSEDKCIIIPDLSVVALDVCKCSSNLCNTAPPFASHCSFLLAAAAAAMTPLFQLL